MTAIRNKKGQFVKGHAPTFTGFKPGDNVGGRPKTIKGEIKDALELAEEAMPEMYRLAIKRASGRDRKCPRAVQQAAFEYLSDRIYGKANQPMSGNIRQQIIREIIRIPDEGEQAVEEAKEIMGGMS